MRKASVIVTAILCPMAMLGAAALSQDSGPAGAPSKAAGASKFDIPVWHPDARWKAVPEPFMAGTDKSGNLDGPRLEMLWRRGFATWGDYTFFEQRGLPVNFCAYDEISDSVHVVAGSARGYLDGPFSRARWGGQAYMHPCSRAMSGDGRYLVAADSGNRGSIRILDLKEQMVSTLLPPESQGQAVVINSKGQAVVFCKGGLLLTMDVATRQKISELKLKATEGLDLAPGFGLALDEVHGKLYASGHPLPNGNWHVWYFDLKDGGSFHGVLAAKKKKTGSYAGPFDDYASYGEGSIRFGPDDPDKRFLYMAVTDTTNPMRLDLERRVVAMFDVPGKGNGSDGLARFVEESDGKKGNKYISAHSGVGWMPDGSIIVPGSLYEPAMVYRRVK